jgi:hypothetical protein
LIENNVPIISEANSVLQDELDILAGTEDAACLSISKSTELAFSRNTNRKIISA